MLNLIKGIILALFLIVLSSCGGSNTYTHMYKCIDGYVYVCTIDMNICYEYADQYNPYGVACIDGGSYGY